MKDTCTSENSRDFRARYQGTIASLVKGDDERQWVTIKEVNDHSVSFADKRGTTYEAINGNGVVFEFTQVPMGWYNTSKGPLLFIRRPARQWQRGISSQNTRIYNAALAPVTVNLANVEDAFTFKGKPGEISWPWALSKFFCVNKEKEILFLTESIGVVKEDKFVVVPGCMVVQELSDTIRRLGLPHQVVLEEA